MSQCGRKINVLPSLVPASVLVFSLSTFFLTSLLTTAVDIDCWTFSFSDPNGTSWLDAVPGPGN